MSVQYTTHKQSGFDLFFTNMSKKKAKVFVQFLNKLDRTMGGNPMKFKLNKDQSPHPIYGEEQKITITVRYPGVDSNVVITTAMLNKNRNLVETALQEFGWNEVKFEGSEFYIDVQGDPKLFAKNYQKDMKNMMKEVA